MKNMKFIGIIFLVLQGISCSKDINTINDINSNPFEGRDWEKVRNGVFNSAVEGITTYNNKLIVTGNFTTIGADSINRISRLVDQEWLSMGTGLNQPAENLITYNGELYVGGFFTMVDGNPRNFIARYNGSSWEPVQGGMDRPIRSFHIYDNELIVGGSFRIAGLGADNVQSNFISRWNGSEWKSLGTGLDTVAYAMTTFRNELIVAGEFSQADGQMVNNIAAWNGNSWRPLGTGLNSKVYGLTVYRDKLIATGDFTSAGNTSVNYIAEWDGIAWSSLGSGFDGPSIPSQQIEPFGRDVIVFKDRLIAGGGFTTAGGKNADKIAYWDGNEWHTMNNGLNNWVEKMLVHNDTLYVGGFFNHFTEKGFIGFAKW